MIEMFTSWVSSLAGYWFPKPDVISPLEQEAEPWPVHPGVSQSVCLGETVVMWGQAEPIHLCSPSSQKTDYSVS